MCEKDLIFSSRLRHINSKSHIHKEKYGIVVKEYEIIKPEIEEIGYGFDNNIKDCREKSFQKFEYRPVYVFKVTNF